MGGAGLFREEVTRPLGIDVPVIAWGLGLDRMALLAMGLSDIRDLVTPDLARLRGMTVKPDGLLGRKV
jgi:phenylalanyl-tRNA synthetase alpha chain